MCCRRGGHGDLGLLVSHPLESLEPRRLLSGVTATDSLPTEGFVKVAWNGHDVLATPGQWIVKVDGVRGNARRQLEVINHRLSRARAGVRVTAHLGEDGLVRITVPADVTARQLARSFRGVAGFRRLEPDLAVWTAATFSDDPSFGSLWGLHNTRQTGGAADADIDAPEAWDLARGDGSVVVGVIDTGIDYTHPDLAPNVWRNPAEVAGDGVDNDGNGYVDDVYGWDFFNNDADPMDDNGHGTHVAGTLAAAGNNAAGVVGVSWAARVMALKFMGADGSGTLSGAVAAINYATKMRKSYGVNLRVTNNSWGTDRYSRSLYDALKNSGLAGILSVAAAGNGGSDGVGDDNDATPCYPASFDLDSVIAVAATDHNDVLASFSNYGDVSVDVAAPGVGILSTTPGGGYARLSGTSMAAPHVAGMAALGWTYSPGASYQAVRSAVFNGADAKSSLAGKVLTGGRVNAYGTLRQLPAAPAAPENLAATAASDSRIDLAWADNSASEEGFRIYRSTDGLNFSLVATVAANATGYGDGALSAETTYSYRVRAYNGVGESAESNTAEATTHAADESGSGIDNVTDNVTDAVTDPVTDTITDTRAGTAPVTQTAPAAPLDLSAAAISWIDLAWADHSEDEEGFRVYRSSDGVSFSHLADVVADATGFRDGGAAVLTTYYYIVRAYNAAGESAASNTASAVVRPTVPAAPADLVARILPKRRLHLTWADNAANEDGFTIERSGNGVKWFPVATVPADETTYGGRHVRKSRYYRVRAFNSAGESGFSNAARAIKAPRTASAAPISPFSERRVAWAGATSHLRAA